MVSVSRRMVSLFAVSVVCRFACSFVREKLLLRIAFKEVNCSRLSMRAQTARSWKVRRRNKAKWMEARIGTGTVALSTASKVRSERRFKDRFCLYLSFVIGSCMRRSKVISVCGQRK